MDERGQVARAILKERVGQIIKWLGRRMRLSRHQRLLEDRAWSLYPAVVGRARQPFLYSEIGVPDTTEGRFEMVQLHVGLMTLRLDEAGIAGRELAQVLFDCMMKDMDRSLRELRIGDLSIGKYVRRMAQSFYYRLQHLDRALATGEIAPMEEILARNVFGDERNAAVQAAKLWQALVAEAQALQRLPSEDLLAGRLGERM